ncbi:hypothetical protein Dvina_16620 [Dactylosporangium vinaceum]|uniref:Uncharacterized protein n=1 Tax=Dactylosporangium vinaceum TaxID=53362 RepID=A0ABV5M8V2_9ACTN|nr:hypothetical protein [Dactylosporangium vinaceum]UAB99547.1 hypothetical protein Dvina_16620 [Dactylosporangium vinaceum]
MIEETLHHYARQDVPMPPLPVAQVLAEARRRRRRRLRRIGAAATAAAVLAVVGAVAVARTFAGPSITAAGPGCAVERLPLPPGVSGGVMTSGIDPSGRLVIGKTGDRNAAKALLWSGGAVAVLPESFVPQAVNAAGMIVGFTGPDRRGDDAEQRPVAWDGTRLIRLPLPDGAIGGTAYAVNAGGDVLGTLVRADGTWIAVSWRTAGGAAIVSVLPGRSGLGLTDAGVAVGVEQSGGRPVRWTPGSPAVALARPAGTESSAPRSAAGDWAAGPASKPPTGDKNADFAMLAARWNLRTGAVELIPGISGEWVSGSGAVAGLTNQGEPAVWRDGQVYVLPMPADFDPGGSIVAGLTADGHDLAGSVNGPVVAGATGTVGDHSVPIAPNNTVPVVWRGC